MESAAFSNEYLVVEGRNRKVRVFPIPATASATTVTGAAAVAGHKLRLVGWEAVVNPALSAQFKESSAGAGISPVFTWNIVTAGTGGVRWAAPLLSAGYGDTAAGKGIDVVTSAVTGGSISGYGFFVDLDE